MAHECEVCGMQCYCDIEDVGGMPQPNDCKHIRAPERYCESSMGDHDDPLDEDQDEPLAREVRDGE